MCFAGLGAVVGLAGSAMSASAQAEQGQREKQIADANAERQRQAGIYQAKQIHKKVSYVNATTTNQAASHGLQMSGSVLDVMTDNAVNGEIDAANAIKTSNDQARVSNMEGSAAQAKGNNMAAASIIGGFAKFASSSAFMGMT